MDNLEDAIDRIIWLEGEIIDLRKQLEELKVYVDQ